MSLYLHSLTLPSPDELHRREQFLEKTRAKLERRIANAPEGSLVVTRKGKTGVANFYHVLPDRSRHYLNQTQKVLIRRLAQKEYDQKALRLVTPELEKLREVFDYYNMPKLEDAYDRCLPVKQDFIQPLLPSDTAFREAWLAQAFIQKDQNDGAHIFPTERGDMVCSKSEGMEADYMFYHKYDYLYEKRIELLDHGRVVWRYPDFTILDPVTREEVIFEHFGMVDDPEYARAMFDKIRLYQENGYIIGKNFLFTFETRDHPFTIDQFVRILEARFGG